FLVDGAGRVEVIYKGPVAVDDLLEDAGHSKRTRAERWRCSAPLAGRTIDHEIITRAADDFEAAVHFQHALHRESMGDVERAIGHYRESLRIRPHFGGAHRNLGRLHSQRGDWREALPHFVSYAEIHPDDPAGHHALGLTHRHLGNLPAARSELQAAVRLQGNHVPALDALGELQLLAGQAAEAAGSFRAVLKLAPRHASATNNLAWILATHPDDELRDPEEALRLATRLVGGEGGDKPEFLDTLAAAQAGSGRFEEAITTARRGVTLARAAGQEQLAGRIEEKIAHYERSEPFRDQADPPDRE
ncbi:MAG: tetratricopeptide repeat protein, partial [Akkermansiaceae bacterium]|nr:tetratricopeptide repeat protein [Akkermansiaceae bacterium]